MEIQKYILQSIRRKQFSFEREYRGKKIKIFVKYVLKKSFVNNIANRKVCCLCKSSRRIVNFKMYDVIVAHDLL